MPEVKKEAKIFIINYICDSCGIGKMIQTGDMLIGEPPKFPHKCTNCHMQINFSNMAYPRTITE